MRRPSQALSSAQQLGLVLLRSLIGWHFLYEGYYKLLFPAWSRSGQPLPAWSSAGYLRGAWGPFASVFHAMAESPWLPWLDIAVCVGLTLVGLSLLLGLYTEAGCVGGLFLLAMFYVSAIPSSGVQEPHSEGAYLFVNKNLIEAGALLVLLAFRTGRLAGLDRWLAASAAARPAEEASP